MILEYGVHNFLSFKDGGVVSFRLDGHVPETVSGGLSHSTVLCVKGANGSGKTHLLKGLSFMASFISDSFTSLKVDEEIGVVPFGDSKDFSSFYVEFFVNDLEYRYELDTYSDRVVKEVLFRKKKRKTKLFERVGDSVIEATNEFEWLKKIKYRKNASVISTAHQHEIETVKDIHHFFDGISSNVRFDGHDFNFGDLDKVSKFLYEQDDAKEVVELFLKDFDTGVSKIKILEHESGVRKGKIYIPYFLHVANNEEIWVSIETNRVGLFSYTGRFLRMLRQCKILQ